MKMTGLWDCPQLRTAKGQSIVPTNQKGQMPPRRLFTLTRGIQIRGQPIKKNIHIKQLFSADAKLFSKKNEINF
jgi:hypothetical protein